MQTLHGLIYAWRRARGTDTGAHVNFLHEAEMCAVGGGLSRPWSGAHEETHFVVFCGESGPSAGVSVRGCSMGFYCGVSVPVRALAWPVIQIGKG